MSSDDLDRLRAETRVLWGASSRGAQEPPPAVVLVADDRSELLCAPGFSSTDLTGATFEGGPSYLVTAPGSVPAEVRTSADGPVGVPPPPNWDQDEWDELMSGGAGAWALVVRGGVVAAWCFSSRDGPDGVEAGVWTAPAHRGQGLATAVTAGWAARVSAGGRPAYYSTSADNLASQAVAARLGYRRLGWTWKVRPS